MRQAVIVLALCIASVAQAATPQEQLESARSAFKNRDFSSAAPLLTYLLYPKPRLSRPDDLVEAYVLLGVCDFELGKREEAKREFENALAQQPDKTLDTLLFSAGAVRLFDETRQDIELRKQKDAELRKLQEERDRLKKIRENTYLYETHPYYVNFVPFGAGQFQNRQSFKGVMFAAGEGLTFAGSTGIFLYLVGKYGLNCPHCVKTEDAESVRTYQQLEIGLGVAFIGIYVGGVIDSLLHYKPRAQLDDSQLPPELLKDLDKNPKKKTSFRDRIHVLPMVTPQGVGIGVGWEN